MLVDASFCSFLCLSYMFSFVRFAFFYQKTLPANILSETSLIQSENGKEWITVSAATLSVNPLFYTHSSPFGSPKPYSAFGSKYSSVSIVPSKSKYIRNWNLAGYDVAKDEFDAKGKSLILALDWSFQRP